MLSLSIIHEYSPIMLCEEIVEIMWPKPYLGFENETISGQIIYYLNTKSFFAELMEFNLFFGCVTYRSCTQIYLEINQT